MEKFKNLKKQEKTTDGYDDYEIDWDYVFNVGILDNAPYNDVAYAALFPSTYNPRPVYHFLGDCANPSERIFYSFELDVVPKPDHKAPRMISDAVLWMQQNFSWLYCKYDNTLPELGFTIASHPFTRMWLDVNTINVNNLLWRLDNWNFISHDDPACKFHTHISKEAYGDKVPHAEIAVGRIIYNDWTSFDRFSRRDFFCSVPVNTDSASVIKLQFWRGTLIPLTFLATLQLTINIGEYVREYVNDENLDREIIKTVSLKRLVDYKDHKELIGYYKRQMPKR
jgi:hypothetical protein